MPGSVFGDQHSREVLPVPLLNGTTSHFIGHLPVWTGLDYPVHALFGSNRHGFLCGIDGLLSHPSDKVKAVKENQECRPNQGISSTGLVFALCVIAFPEGNGCSSFMLAVYMVSISGFSALTLLVGWQEGHPVCKNWVVVDGTVIYLGEVQNCIWSRWWHSNSLSLCSSESELVLFFWYWLTRVVPEKGR